MQLTIKQAAELLSVSEAQVRRWIKDRGLPAVSFNEQWRLNRFDVVAWAQTNQLPVANRVVADGGGSAEPLDRVLARGGIHRDLQSASVAAALGDLSARLPLDPREDRELLTEMIVLREAHRDSAVAHGISIPLARHPTIITGPAPIVALGLPREPVRHVTADPHPIRAFFVVLAPTTRVHLDLLAQLALALTRDLSAAVLASESDARILAAAHVEPAPTPPT